MNTVRLADYRFTKTHEWIDMHSASGRVGITDYAQSELTDMVYVDLPKLGMDVIQGKHFAVVESVKAASDLYAPVTGKVIASNQELSNNPGLINTDPYGAGWLAEFEVVGSDDLSRLLNYVEYKADVLEEVVHILYLDENNRIHYLPAVRGDDGQVAVRTSDLATIVTSSIISIAQKRKQEAAEEFEYMINKPALKENELQVFFEKHPEFLLGSDYESIHPQIVLKQNAEDDLKPDFILKPLAGVSYEPKIVELKLPSQAVIKPTARREGLYANIHEGIRQLRAYARYFQESQNREYVRNLLNFTAYQPRLALIVGKRIDFGDDKLKAEILQSQPGVELVTYEDILQRYKEMVKMM